jgi:hypothetical protein
MRDDEQLDEKSGERLDEDSVETVPVERRHVPRGLVPGLTAEVLDGPLKGETFEVRDVGLESLFLDGAESEPGRSLRIRLSLEEATHECTAESVRCEEETRRGTVVRLLPDQPETREFLESILLPSKVPPGHH